MNDGSIPEMGPGDRTSPFICVALPNRSAEETSVAGRSCNLWGTSLSAVVLEIDGYLIRAHFEEAATAVVAKKASATAREYIYEGRFELTSTSTVTTARVDAMHPQYSRAIGHIQFDGERPSDLQLLVHACVDYTFIANNGSSEVTFHWSRLGANHPQRVELKPGCFIQLEAAKCVDKGRI